MKVDAKKGNLARRIANARRLVSFLLIAIALTFAGMPSVHAHVTGPVDSHSSDHHHGGEDHGAHYHGESPGHEHTSAAGHQSDPFCCDDTACALRPMFLRLRSKVLFLVVKVINH